MSQISQNVIVGPSKPLQGEIEVAGDKSISHRVAMLASIAKGESEVRNFLQSEDCLNTLRAMEALGARSFFDQTGALHIHGTGGKLIQPAGVLDVGNSGTTIRLLAGLLAGQSGVFELTGDESLRNRPMARIKDPLEKMGAKVELTGERGTAPIRIMGAELKAIDYVLPVASAQVKSCILLAALYAEGTTSITEPLPTRDHTERLFKMLGLPLTVVGDHMTLTGFGKKGPAIQARSFDVPGDFSSAAFWLVAAAAREGSRVVIRNVGLNPRRTALLDVLARAGANVRTYPASGSDAGEPYGDIEVTGGSLRAVEVGGAEIPNLIDELPLVAVLGALSEGETVIRDAAELRVKESDRIATMAANLRLMGVEVEETPDGMRVRGPALLKPSGALRSYGDHRIAMAMSILAGFAAEKTVISNVACVSTSYPTFWQDYRSLGGHVE
ncbi:MAG: 3-phosphoshikimate 1-carboxyvinyltransferase [Kiritimatiellae bacterium]|nr:3-phosphoshikimate 1-carboxyvinyltransferase [Kiritimatiellia bacterium]MDW8458409.1 3-phosphoshikimate 1-carboxyvinyltransferase [Verrucomicrobiota bacterium]